VVYSIRHRTETGLPVIAQADVWIPTQTAVRAVHDVGPDAVAIDLESPTEFDAQPGQFVKLTFDLAGKLEFEAIERLAAEGELDVETADELERGDEGTRLSILHHLLARRRRHLRDYRRYRP